jgi:hypothetical protein
MFFLGTTDGPDRPSVFFRPFEKGGMYMENEKREVKQDLQEIEVLDEGLEHEADVRSICCIGPFLPLVFH